MRTDLESLEAKEKGLHKGAVLQHPGGGLVFKELGVAKRYCGRDSMGNRFSQYQETGSE